jgi:outer membrane protein
MRLSIITGALFFGIATQAYAQTPEKWDLQRCVEYAMKNSINVRQADLTRRSSEIVLKQSQLQQIPSAAYNLSHGFSFGRTLDRTTNVYISRSAMFQQMSLQAQALLFNFGSQSKTIAANKYTLEADQAAVDKAKNDIGLNTANQYLTALANKEQIQISRIVLQQTQAQLANTRKLVAAGSLPELNAAELEATVARDSASVVQAEANYQLALLSLKAFLNLPADYPFDIEAPPIDRIPLDNILEENPATVYAMAMQNQPQIRGNQLRLHASEKTLAARKARLYPSFSAFGQLQTNYNQLFDKASGFNITGESPTGTYAKLGTDQLPVYAPTGEALTTRRSFGQMWENYWDELGNQFGQSLGLSMNVPIFQGWQNKAAVEQAKLQIENNKLNLERDTLRLKQDIYTAYETAMGAFQTYVAREKAVQTAERSFELATRRYEIGVMQTIEWLTNQNNLTRARIDKILAQYNYVFAMKVLEFYKGQGLRL